MEELATAENELREQQQRSLHALTSREKNYIKHLSVDLKRARQAPTITDRDRKELLRILLEEAYISVLKDEAKILIVLHWEGGLFSELEIKVPPRKPTIKTDEDTVLLLTRLAQH